MQYVYSIKVNFCAYFLDYGLPLYHAILKGTGECHNKLKVPNDLNIKLPLTHVRDEGIAYVVYTANGDNDFGLCTIDSKYVSLSIYDVP